LECKPVTSKNPENPIDPQQTTPHAEGKPYNHAPKSDPEIPPAIGPTKPVPPPAPKQETQAREKEKHWLDYLEAGMAGFGLVVLIAYTIATIAIWCANKKAADAAKVAAEAAERANDVATYSLTASQRSWVQVADNNPKESDKKRIKDYTRFDFPERITNIGKTPARKVKVDAVVEIVEVGKEPKLTYYDLHDIVLTSVLFPDTPRDFSGSIIRNRVRVQPSAEEREGLANGDLYVAVYGRVSYEDDFGPHWTHYCWWQRYDEKPPAEGQAKTCTEYNDVDPTPQPKTQ
jgi:hypothetical protein